MLFRSRLLNIEYFNVSVALSAPSFCILCLTVLEKSNSLRTPRLDLLLPLIVEPYLSNVNSFGGNDIDSNSYIGLAGIKDVLVDMFDEHGELKHFVENKQFFKAFINCTFLSNYV